MHDIFERLEMYLSMPFDELQARCEALSNDAKQAEKESNHEKALAIGLDYVAAHSALSAIASRENNEIIALSAAKLAKQGLGVVIYKVQSLDLPSDESSREIIKQQIASFDQAFFNKAIGSEAESKKGCLSAFIFFLSIISPITFHAKFF